MKTLLSVIFFLFCFGAYSQKYEQGKYFINDKKDTIYITPEQMPEFPGGVTECLRFIGRNLDYISGCSGQYRVIVGFIINEDGSISDIETMRSEGEYYDKEAKRVISIMPKWKPGVHKGKIVKTRYILPVTFRLQ